MTTLTEEALNEFTEWLAREMPPGTVISDPRWWAPRIAARFAEHHIAAGQQGARDEMSPERVLVEYERIRNNELEDEVPREMLVEAMRTALRLATPQPPKPAGAVPLPEPLLEVLVDSAYGPQSRLAAEKYYDEQSVVRYGEAREAAALAKFSCCNICNKCGDGAGRAGAVPDGSHE